MYYPRECYCISEAQTRINKQAYDEVVKREARWIEEHYPDYHKLGLRERMRISVEYKKVGA